MPISLSHSMPHGLTAVMFQQVVVSTTVLALVIPEGMTPLRVVLSVHSNAIRIRWDGVDPTPTVGHQLTAGAGPSGDVSRGFELIGSLAITHFRMVRDANADAEVAYTIEA